MTPQEQVPQSIKDDLSQLKELMVREFELLKSRSLEDLNSCDEDKTALLSRLQGHAEFFIRAEHFSAEWMEARDALKECRDLHFRNLQLLRRQLDAIQGALQSLAGGSMPASETYDRQGTIRHASQLRGLLMA